MTVSDLAAAFQKADLLSGNLHSPDGERLIAHIMPANLEEADDLAADFGFERVDGELDRRTYEEVTA